MLEILYAFGYEFCMILLHTAKCQRGELDNLRGCGLLVHKTTSLSVSDLLYVQVKCFRYRPGVAQRVGRGVEV